MSETSLQGEREIRTLVLLELEDASLYDTLGREALAGHDRLVRDGLARFSGREVEKSRRFLLLFERPLDAVGFCLAYHAAMQELAADLGLELRGRAAIHLGEVVLWENAPEDVARGAKPLEVEGPARTVAGQLLALARGGRTLLTRTAHDLARREAVGGTAESDGVAWLSRGPYRFPPDDRVIEAFEVGAPGIHPSSPPRLEAFAEPRPAAVSEDRLAWRPEAGHPVPHRPHWVLERRLDGAAFGEEWLAAHSKTREPRAFHFALRADEPPRLERQLAVLRRLRDALGDPGFTVRPIDSHFGAETSFLESEHVEARPLLDWAAERGGLEGVPVATRLELVAQLADALAAVHGSGVVLGDLRPPGLRVAERPGETPRLLLAELSRTRLLDPKAARGLPGAETGAPAPPPYRAPELADGDPVSPAGDLYALGVLLYQMAAGRFAAGPGPFWQRDVGDEILCADVAALLEPSPEVRFADPNAMARRLRSLGERREAESRRQADETAAQARRDRRRHLAYAVAGFLLGALIVAVFLLP